MILNFTFRGEPYAVNEKGHIRGPRSRDFSPSWIFRGGATHHMHRGPTVTLAEAFGNPARLSGCYGFDIDHGTPRAWGGMYAGGIPRIRDPYTVG